MTPSHASDTLPDCLTLEWYIADVQALRPDLTEAQCRTVLHQVERAYDAAIGVNWLVLEAQAEMLYGACPDDDAVAD